MLMKIAFKQFNRGLTKHIFMFARRCTYHLYLPDYIHRNTHTLCNKILHFHQSSPHLFSDVSGFYWQKDRADNQ